MEPSEAPMKKSIRGLLMGLSIPTMLLTASVGAAADIQERNIKPDAGGVQRLGVQQHKVVAA
jgi:hypothetical protein